MKKFKVYSIFMLIAFLIVTSTSLNAASTNITGSASVKTGEKVTVTISGSQIAVWDINVTYDNAKLELVSGKTKIVATSDSGKNENVTIATLVFKTKIAGSASVSIDGSISGEDKVKLAISKKYTTNITDPVAPPPVTVSSNANLKRLSVNVEGLSPAFSKNRTAYSLNVNENINSITVRASTEDEGATFYVSGNKNLVVGNNTVNIVVTAADKKTKKTYRINVVKSNNPELSDATLQSLVVEDISLTPEFDTNVIEYLCNDIEGNISKLNITAYAKNEKAKVEILGNENFKVGENIITIKVTSESGLVTKEYFLKINKKETPIIEKEVEIYEESNSIKSEPAGIVKFFKSIGSFLKRHLLVIILSTICIFEFIVIVFLLLFIKNGNTPINPSKKNRKSNEDDLDIIDCVLPNTRRRNLSNMDDVSNITNIKDIKSNKEEILESDDKFSEQDKLQKEIEEEIEKNF
ncbi:MAG: cadherin-like beta sandwich domain-containing protein [Clostridia bacterium]